MIPDGRRAVPERAGRWLREGWWLLLLVVPFVVPVPGRLERMHVLRAFGVLAHFFLPGVIVWLVTRRGPLAGRWRTGVLLGFTLVASCELVQGYVGRHPRWQDALVDLAGASCAAAWLRWRVEHRRRLLAVALALLAVLPWQLRRVPGIWLGERLVAARFPLLADFETRRELALWEVNEENRPPPVGGVDAGHGRSLMLEADSDDTWAGVIMHGMPRDWRPYRALVFSARVTEGEAAWIGVRLAEFDSKESGRYLQRRFSLEHRWRTYRLELRPVPVTGAGERTFRLDDLESMLFYIPRPDRRTVVAIDDIHLE